jgi:hypothetical protein
MFWQNRGNDFVQQEFLPGSQVKWTGLFKNIVAQAYLSGKKGYLK